MKKLLKITLTLFIIITIILGFALPLNMPPGWYQQTLPLNDWINDIFFIDTSNGWLVTQGSFPANDTSSILRTTNGGNNWVIQKSNRENLNVIQFLDLNTGYAAGGINGSTNTTFYKTTNSGTNWIAVNNLGGIQINDIHFINKDTGWVCDNNFTFGAGLQKTTNGGVNWFLQLPRTYCSTILFFLNKDTGWTVGSQTGGTPKELHRTTNGGTNWNLLYIFSEQLFDIYFFNVNVGVVTTATLNQRTTNGGINWALSNEPGSKLSFVNDSVGWAGSGTFLIMKTRNGGQSWYRQSIPVLNSTIVFAIDTSNAWAGRNTGLIHTTDGGGPTGIQQISSEIPLIYLLFQNYPNPFNPETNIKYQIIKSSFVLLSVYDITGKNLINLVNQKQSAGTYQADWNALGYSSGVYFYKLTVSNGKEEFTETKKMMLVK